MLKYAISQNPAIFWESPYLGNGYRYLNQILSDSKRCNSRLCCRVLLLPVKFHEVVAAVLNFDLKTIYPKRFKILTRILCAHQNDNT